jgi:hypothetical protein
MALLAGVGDGLDAAMRASSSGEHVSCEVAREEVSVERRSALAGMHLNSPPSTVPINGSTNRAGSSTLPRTRRAVPRRTEMKSCMREDLDLAQVRLGTRRGALILGVHSTN